MTRDQYINAIQQVHLFDAECERASYAIQAFAADEAAPTITLGAKLLSAYLDLVEEAVGDTPAAEQTRYESWTRWYLYETRKQEDRWCTIGTSHYKVADAGDLYDVIQAWRKHIAQ